MNRVVTSTDGREPTHTFSEAVERDPSGDGNLTKYTPTCSCGWRGFGIQSYNDDLVSRLRQQEKDHVRMVMRNCDW